MAGGILSAAVDGIKVAEAVARSIADLAMMARKAARPAVRDKQPRYGNVP
ncbi:MAG: hypothetical protein WDM89_03210 [Rhizomicrobium sp.]